MVSLNGGFGNTGNIAVVQNSLLIPKYYQLSECDLFIKYSLGFLVLLSGNINKRNHSLLIL